MRTPAQQGPLGRAVCRGASVELEDPVTKQQESVCVGTDSLGLSVRKPVPGDVRHAAPARTEGSVKAKGSATAPLDGRVLFVPSAAQRDGMDQTVLTNASATTGANVTLKPDSVSVPKASLVADVTRSVL